jgi:hypothetical protein
MTPEEIAEQDREIASLIAQAGQPRCSSQHPGLGLRCDMVRGHADDHWYAELTWPRRRK